MRQARSLDGQRKHALVLAAVQAAVHQGHVLTVAAIARAAGVGRKFIYDHPDLRAEIDLTAAHATHRRPRTATRGLAPRLTGTEPHNEHAATSPGRGRSHDGQ